jgi:hypothetical protein
VTVWVFYGNGARLSNAGASSLTPALPTISNLDGGLLIAMAAAKSAANITTATSGWTRRGYVSRGSSWSAAFFTAPVGSAAPVITGTTLVLAQTVCVGPATAVLAAAPVGTISTSNGNTSPHTTTGFNTTGNNALACYIGMAAANTAFTEPSGWTEELDVGSATGASRNVFGMKRMGASGSATGNISINGAAADWIQWQFEILTEESPGMAVPFLETTPWLDGGDGAATPLVEVVPWLDGGDGAATPLVEVVPWLRNSSGVEIPIVEIVPWPGGGNGVAAPLVEVVTWLKPAGPSRRRNLDIN